MQTRREAKEALFEQFARVTKALGSPRRLELIDLLAQGERSVEALARSTDTNLTTVSAHLQALRRANLVATRRDGTRIYYRLAGPDVGALYVQVQRIAEAHLPDLPAVATAFLGEDDSEEIGREELLRRLQDGSVTVIDVRPGEEYASGHIPGAMSIPLGQLAERLGEIPAGTDVVATCRGPYCVLSHDAVRILHDHGITARRLSDGVLEWSAASLPLERAGA
ncbi:ArsR/SmtB family transcription factor [Myceligenerans pegani]|uniref:Metalloregulator ArsR/SmtB family transcription factor n=1 Tax=Myceligenerans pegani TaxID=2776917 RepID=A0ABR9N309_9MICO|nr:metalloregulator ArsR/SmtB family transcription factor [Myceligenerans sp. TRM 65318]MBE1878043.1 metalloregulator ArsR/SmtB family transcription factor [Myceligenerans sp. TRM 65318]MBE3020314.1 metalloregulator ArsR/SmtB family transcription factor [Myceligenerans sp. TRM 65318]